MELTEKEFKEMKRSLKFGTKGKCAAYIGIKSQALSRYLKPGSKYDRSSKRFKLCYELPDHIYAKIQEFVNLNKQ